MKQQLKEIDTCTLMFGYFNNIFSIIDRTTRQRVNIKRTQQHQQPTGIYKTLHKMIVEYTLFSNVHRTDTGIDHIMGHETHFNKLKINLNYRVCSPPTMKPNQKSITER